MSKRIEAVGMVFGLLTIFSDAESSTTNKRMVSARCDCGSTKDYYLTSLMQGITKSCGCEQKRKLAERVRTHGYSGTKLYAVWSGLKSRCLNCDDPGFKDYGGRGITVCAEWVGSFPDFKDFALNNGWKPGLRIDRIDNDGGYSPANCRFVTQQENCNNTRISTRNKTGFRGVHKTRTSFAAGITSTGNCKHYKAGFKTPIEAAIYRDEYCRSHGIHAKMNFSKEVI